MTNNTIKPEYQALYPAKDSLQEVVDEAMASIPIDNANELKRVMMTYHNTLLSIMRKGNDQS